MQKEQYIKQELQGMIQSLSGLLFLAGGAAIIALGMLDFLVTPENFKIFMVYRLIAASLFIPLYFTLSHSKSTLSTTIHLVLATIIVSTMVEAMILHFGGHQSTYYAGMLVGFIFLFGLLPISLKLSSVLSLLIYSIYLVPILVFDEIINVRIFLNNNLFLIAIFLTGLLWRHFNYKIHLKMLSLQYDLEQQKKQLEIYSTQLEGLVADRTKELRKSEQWHRSIIDNANDGIIIVGSGGQIVNVNDKACEMHNCSRDMLVGAHISDLENSDKQDAVDDRMRRLLCGESMVYESLHRRKDETAIYLEVSAKAITI